MATTVNRLTTTDPIPVTALGMDTPRYHPTAERILTATIEAIETLGEAAVRLADIAKSVDMTIPAMYRYFKDREELIVAARVRRYDQINAELSEAMLEVTKSVTSAEGFAQVIDAVVDALISPARRDELFTRSEILARCRHNPELLARVSAQHDHNMALVTDVLKLAQNRAWVDPGVDVDVVARLFVAIMYGQLSWYLSDPEPDIAEQRDAVRLILQSMVRAESQNATGPAPLIADGVSA